MLQICFEFIQTGHAGVTIRPDGVNCEWTISDCNDWELASGRKLIYFNGASTGGCTMTISVDGVEVARKEYPEGVFNDLPIIVNV